MVLTCAINDAAKLTPRMCSKYIFKRLILPSIKRNFPANSVGSNLHLQQLRTVAEHSGHRRVLRTKSLLQNLRGPSVQRLCFDVLALENKGTTQELWSMLNQRVHR